MSKNVNLITTIETIGPATAKAYLEHSAKNRGVSPVAVKRYADAMAAGAWELSHQGIAFNESGALCDGQHRMLAVIRSGATVKFQVTRYRAEAPMAVLDSGRARSAGDRIVLSGLVDGNGKSVAAIFNAMMLIERPKRAVLQAHELRALFKDDGEHVMWSIGLFQAKKRQWNAVIRGAFAYCRPFAKDKVDEMARMVADQAGYEEGSAAHAFVRALVEGKMAANHHNERVEALSRALRCIQAHVEGEAMPRLVSQSQSLAWAYKQRSTRGLLLTNKLTPDNGVE